MKFFIFKYSIAILSCIYFACFFYESPNADHLIKMGTAMALAFIISVSMLYQIRNRR